MEDQEKTVVDRRQFSVDEAESLTGFTKQQISKFGRRLQEPEKYRLLSLAFLGLFGRTQLMKLLGAAEKSRQQACVGNQS